ncbi:hypothetical protein BDV98DRAFT_97677 [Pterulicium gracile]|uniref:Derlin n=1 Tax=Pterulicium gracile TaxID=1884261 RepID=A0A5C3QFI9_9AGAR|nr:hypothetical protein BDV98DRAFT_97677 [Pterula gracilis]
MARISVDLCRKLLSTGAQKAHRLGMTVPPVTRFVTLLSLVLVCSVKCGVKEDTIRRSLLYVERVLKNRKELMVFGEPVPDISLEIRFVLASWRIMTSLFIGSGGLGFVLNFVLLYHHSDLLESGPYGCHSPSYAWQLILACIPLITINNLAFHSRYPSFPTSLHRALSICITHLYLSTSSSRPTEFLGFPIAYIAYLLPILDWAQHDTILAAVQPLTGLVVGYAWYVLFWRPGKNEDGTYRPLGPLASWIGNAPGIMSWVVNDRANGDMSDEELARWERHWRAEKKEQRAKEKAQRARGGARGEEERRGLLRSDYRPPPMTWI